MGILCALAYQKGIPQRSQHHLWKIIKIIALAAGKFILDNNTVYEAPIKDCQVLPGLVVNVVVLGVVNTELTKKKN